jgi:hypothetical protein
MSHELRTERIAVLLHRNPNPLLWNLSPGLGSVSLGEMQSLTIGAIINNGKLLFCSYPLFDTTLKTQSKIHTSISTAFHSASHSCRNNPDSSQHV